MIGPKGTFRQCLIQFLDDDTWGDDWGTPAVKTVKSAAEKKAERDAKMKARKVFSN